MECLIKIPITGVDLSTFTIALAAFGFIEKYQTGPNPAASIAITSKRSAAFQGRMPSTCEGRKIFCSSAEGPTHTSVFAIGAVCLACSDSEADTSVAP